MGIIKDNEEIPLSEDILLDKWKHKSVYGFEKPNVPSYCVFNNTAHCLEILHRHIVNNSRIVFSTDVDVDGVGTTYILKKTLDNLGSNRHLMLINKEKVHGIQKKHVDYFKVNKIDLMVITDSSSNEIGLIKKFECDVVVIDHHELLHDDLYGKCDDGIHEYVIVNNTIDNYNQDFDNCWLRQKNASAFNNLEEYKGTKDMSCGLVVYEILRLYCECFANPKLISNLMLYQWVGITLFTDMINTLNERNQWYLNKTVFNMDTEPSILSMMKQINGFKASLDKSYIQYSFAPLINKAIRAGMSTEALDIVINNPYNINNLRKYGALQEEAIDKATTITVKDSVTGLETKSKRAFTGKNIILDAGSLGIGLNYNGVIAGRLSGDTHKNTAVYQVTPEEKCKGSFRGKYQTVDYRKYFASYSEDVYAQGHPTAFGFELTYEQLEKIMNSLDEIEPHGEQKPYITLGNLKPEEYGTYHIKDLNEFKRYGFLLMLATGNSKVRTSDEIKIRVGAQDVKLKNTAGKVYMYDVLGLECKAFKPLSGKYFDIYIEFTNEITMYIR